MTFPKFHRWTVGQVIQALERYRAPLEARRLQESGQTWRPLYERALQLVGETVDEDWPFQVYPAHWKERALELAREARLLLEREVDCHYPQRADSNFGRVLGCLEKAAEDHAQLSGREVGMCRAILKQSEVTHGELGSARRARHHQERSRACRTASRASESVEALSEALAERNPHGGLEDPDRLLSKFPDLPASVEEKVRRAGYCTASEYLRERPGTDLSALLSLNGVGGDSVRDCLQAWVDEASWLTTGGKERVTLHSLLSIPGSFFDPAWDPVAYARQVRPFLEGSLYARYYTLPVDRLEEHIGHLADSRPVSGIEAMRRDRELRTALGGEIMALKLLGVTPGDVAVSFNLLANFCRRQAALREVKPYREKRRRNRLALAFRQGVALLSGCPGSLQQSLLRKAVESDPEGPWRGLEDCRKNCQNWHVLAVWQAEDEPPAEN